MEGRKIIEQEIKMQNDGSASSPHSRSKCTKRGRVCSHELTRISADEKNSSFATEATEVTEK